jgi:hypothetical protein
VRDHPRPQAPPAQDGNDGMPQAPPAQGTSEEAEPLTDAENAENFFVAFFEWHDGHSINSWRSDVL